MFQETIIVGNVGREVTMKYTPGGDAVADFTVAVNKRFTGKDGELVERTTWFRVTCWRKLAETVNQHVYKGMQVLVTGEVDVSAYLKDGEARATLELTARDVRFLSRKDDAPGGGGAAPLDDIPFAPGFDRTML